MPLLGPTPLLLSPMLLLLLSLLPPEGALSLVLERKPSLRGFPEALPGLDASTVQEMWKRYENWMNQLRRNQSWQDWSPDSSTASVRILTPEVRPGPGNQVHLLIPRAVLSAGRPPAPRLQQALLRLTPTGPTLYDVTRPLQRLLAHGGPALPVLRLPVSPPPSDPKLAARLSARLELHLRPSAARGRRSTRVPTAEACAAGAAHCCGVKSRRVTVEELGWADWVLAPRELDVRACVGACPSRFRPASAHARIKARLHDLDPVSAPAPCCVPASFESVVLLHQDSDGGVTITPYDDILVKDCHCA
ncbi:growth/differentiation factor 15 [Orycteropus afer afer]|uniref:Growth/differentiation factor 15 n=1 Tax=Orycteropus afer afer TaxID=1230840 RepID=A0A8B7A6S1_ORYAF|nr:growth/differentiation factor 15 [Orycteropus afer afer]